jgi:hypothetical protein
MYCSTLIHTQDLGENVSVLCSTPGPSTMVTLKRTIYYGASEKDHLVVDLSRWSRHYCQHIYSRNRAKLRRHLLKRAIMIYAIYLSPLLYANMLSVVLQCKCTKY